MKVPGFIAENIMRVGQDIHIDFGTASPPTVQSGQQILSLDSKAHAANLNQKSGTYREDLDGLEDVIDDTAYQFWECGRCLSMGHTSVGCIRDIRCRTCFNYGHK
jgi:hypothetical protein